MIKYETGVTIIKEVHWGCLVIQGEWMGFKSSNKYVTEEWMDYEDEGRGRSRKWWMNFMKSPQRKMGETLKKSNRQCVNHCIDVMKTKSICKARKVWIDIVNCGWFTLN